MWAKAKDLSKYNFLVEKLSQYYALLKESSKYNSLFEVANRLEKLYGGKAYVGLRIPDADTVSRQDIDIVLVTEGKAVVISVMDISGTVAVSLDSSWVIIKDTTKERLPDLVVETKRKASILESYLDLRGVALPEGYFSCYVVLPNPKLRIISSSRLPSEVITYDRWQQLKPEHKSMFSGCTEGAFRGREEMKGSIHSILSTAPMWDRLELKGNKYVLGEFLDFDGIQDEIQAYLMKKIKRSTVSHLLIVQQPSKGFHGWIAEGSMVKVLYSCRDYQGEEGSASKRKEITVSSSIQVLFQPQNWANKFYRLDLSQLVSLSLST
ncbi:hypothetical protein FH972_016062 [Carpinus fangiana]|uniref:NERD domain-containing protein n=1 Tax=Carpinus fangiana TaxID=176857 RepID=A0A5N6REQ4_9ROSI|nr:hypothetical protein FH972_016062 [Carpinus fangiana]